MTGWLITNGFLKGEKFDGIYNLLVEACEKRGVELLRFTNSDILVKIGFNKAVEADFVLFWDKDVKLAAYLEKCGYKVFNSARAIAICDDKALTSLALLNKGIAMPKTIFAPMTFSNVGYTDYNFLKSVAEELGFPLVVKECFGSFGREVYLAKDDIELLKIVENIGVKPMLFQELIVSSYGRDIRVEVVGGKVVASVMRVASEGEFIANVTHGGKMFPYVLSEAEIELAINASKALQLDFAGIDILFGENNKPLLCEVNTNAHFKNLLLATGINVADAIVEYVLGAI